MEKVSVLVYYLLLTKLSIISFLRYSKSYIFPINNLKKAGMPIQPGLLKEFLEKSCEHFRHKLINEYKILFYFYRL